MITIRKILRNKKSQTMSSTSWGNNCHRSLVDQQRATNTSNHVERKKKQEKTIRFLLFKTTLYNIL